MKALVQFLLLGSITFCLQLQANTLKNNNLKNIFIDVEIYSKYVLKERINTQMDNAFHLFSHGKPGELLINGKWLNAEGIVTFLQQQNLSSEIKNLNIYGCEFAKGKKGLAAVQYIQKATGLQVAASTNITGKDGDWLLEVGNKQIKSLESYEYNLQSCAGGFGTEPNEDYDGDGYCNDVDLDDDNDGVLDLEECTIGEVPLMIASKENPASSTGVSKSVFEGTNGEDFLIEMSANPNLNGNNQSTIGGTSFDQEITSSLTLSVTTTYMITNQASEGKEGIVTILNDGNYSTNTTDHRYFTFTYDTGMYEAILIADPGGITAPTPVISPGDVVVSGTEYTRGSIAGGLEVKFVPLREFTAGETTTITFNMRHGGRINVEDPSFRMSINNNCDIDGDGIPNHLDLDSDGDGCPDAIEGGADVLYTNLDAGGSIDASVNDNGIPIMTGVGTAGAGMSGQSMGSSQNAGTQSDECDACNSNSTLYVDTDGDNVGNACDVDDDNDGILDIDENCVSDPISITSGSTPWTGPTEGSTVSVNTTASGATVETRDNTRNFVLDEEYRYDYTEDILITPTSSTNSITVVYTFTPPIPAEEIAFHILNINLGSIDTFNGSFIVTGDATTADFRLARGDTTPWTYDPTNGKIGFVGSEDSYTASIIGVSNNKVSTLTVEIEDLDGSDKIALNLLPVTSCNNDLDGDGIPNKLDLDSDGDGCPDLVEAGVPLTNTEVESAMVTNLDSSTSTNVTVTIVNAQLDTGATVTDTNDNGLNDSVEEDTTATVATVNYTSTYTDNALNIDASTCLYDVSLGKKVDKAIVKEGDQITYTLTVSNDGNYKVTGVAVTDVLPDGVTYVSDDSSGDFVSGTGIWTIGNMEPNQIKTLEIVATVNQIGNITNMAEVTQMTETDKDSIPNNGQ